MVDFIWISGMINRHFYILASELRFAFDSCGNNFTVRSLQEIVTQIVLVIPEKGTFKN